MPDIHARYTSPSSSERYLHCPPSARLSARMGEIFGEEASPFAAEGTKAHAVGELKLRRLNGEINNFVYEARIKELGGVDEEMDKYTDEYLAVITEKLFAARRTDPGAQLFVEQRLHMERWVPECFGTGDAVIVSNDILEVCDLKYGRGVPVSAVGNSQARLYGLGALDAFETLYDFETVRNTIIQPRLDSITEETLTKDELLAWGEEIRPIAQLAYEGKGEFKPGDHCRFCRVKAICSARAAEAMKLFETGASDVATIRDEAIPDILDRIPIFESWAKDIKAYAFNRAMQGVEFKGYILSHGRKGGRKWADENAVIDQLARAGIESKDYTKTELRSPSEIEKLIGKANFRAVLSELCIQPEGKLSLVKDDGTRMPALDSADLAFADLEE